ncbi:MAG: glutamate-1-semialdehyde 2,1-aminomutase [Actinobacteria bacterium]|nr:glutamate-1-semialdehyde 2,1-aminomutase [Thermoleophilia bacterium]MCB9010741.1 glutamate-1-semialdehyde 2,1-aminomutase [Actinomycetota bacterium]
MSDRPGFFLSEAAIAARLRAHQLIPGGNHTYAKGDDQYPLHSPPVIVRGEGCHEWDVDGNRFIGYSLGQRCVTLGHGRPEVVEAVSQAVKNGLNFNRPSLLEGDAAEALLAIVPGADMVKFTKDGSTANTAAVKLARAATGRRMVGLCVDHPFFSYDDWAMGVTPVDAGIPDEAKALTDVFHFNDLDSVDALFDRHDGDVACLMLETCRPDIDPAPGFLEGLRERCSRHGTVLVFDEMTTGFRFHVSGGQGLFGVTPDLSTFGKALGNGVAVSALLGTRELMELGGLETTAPRVFLLSTTHGAESTGLAAAMAVIDVYVREGIVKRLADTGERLRALVQAEIDASGVGDAVDLRGRPQSLLFGTRDPAGAPSQAYRTLLLQELIRGGVLGPALLVSAAHAEEDLLATAATFRDALAVYARALDAGSTDGFLEGPPSQSVYRRYNAP